MVYPGEPCHPRPSRPALSSCLTLEPPTLDSQEEADMRAMACAAAALMFALTAACKDRDLSLIHISEPTRPY